MKMCKYTTFIHGSAKNAQNAKQCAKIKETYNLQNKTPKLATRAQRSARDLSSYSNT